ncbi:MAG: PUR family DNA/RNA-binding protein [Paludibacteraceae bacterium]|nr:PUR family DNA/RNA-binding protein [Paludibacteraceae bacterium]
MEDRRFEDRKEPEIVYSRSVKAGKRIYYLDVKKARNEDLYLCITESKKRMGEDDAPQFEKHKVFLYKEDFAHFTEGLEDVINYVKSQVGTIEERQEWVPENAETVNEPSETKDEEKPRRRLFARLKKD